MNQNYFRPAGLGLLLLFFFASYSLSAQLRLNVDGDARITGGLQMGNSTDKNVFIGINSGTGNTSGIFNSFFGFEAGRDNTTGTANTFMGASAGVNNKNIEGNSFFGYEAGRDNTTGNLNTYLGAAAGRLNRTGSRNTFIGTLAGVIGTDTLLNNAIAIGYSAKVRCSSCAVIGGTGPNAVKVGIGTPLPEEQLHVKGNIRADDGEFQSWGPLTLHPDVDESGDDIVRFLNSAGEENMRIGTDGKVGIGTSSPAELLTVENSSKAALRFARGAAVGQIEQNSSGGAFRLTNPGNSVLIQLRTYGDSYFNGGQIGIGTSAPNHLLDLGASIGKKLAVYQDGSGNEFYGFGIGGGTLEFHAASTPSEDPAMTLTSAGRLGLGTGAPGSELHIKQAGVQSPNGIRLEPSTSTNFWNILVNSNDFKFYYNGVEKGYVDNGTAGFVAGSDRRLKKEIARFDDVLERVMKLRPSSYYYKDVVDPERKAWGFIAQEVEEVFPEIIYQGDTYKGLAYDDFAILSIKAIQEQQLLIEALEEKVEDTEKLKGQVRDQQQQISELRSLVDQLIADQQNGTQGSYVLPLEEAAKLAQNQPNPFNRQTLVDYFVPGNVKDAKIQVTSVDGKVLGTVNIAEKGAGKVTIEANTYPAGTYFYSLVLDGRVIETKRMVLTR